MKLIEMQVIGAMRPPDGSSKALSGKGYNLLAADNSDNSIIWLINQANFNPKQTNSKPNQTNSKPTQANSEPNQANSKPNY